MPDDTVEWTDAQREELRRMLDESGYATGGYIEGAPLNIVIHPCDYFISAEQARRFVSPLLAALSAPADEAICKGDDDA